MKKRVSILLSCYNGSDLIADYIDAILLPEIIECCQLIAVNFPFSHGDPDHVRTHLHRFPDLVYVELDTNLSLYEAWNLAARRAETEFLSNLNLDDRVKPHYYFKGSQILTEESGDVFSAASLMTSTVGAVSPDAQAQKAFADAPPNGRTLISYGIEQMVYADRERIRKQNPPHCAPIWRKSLHDELGYFDCRRFDFAADFEFWLRVASAKKKLFYSTEQMTMFYAATGTASDRLLHSDNEHIMESWAPTFPPPDYTESHLGRRHDRLHHCMNLHAIFSTRAYFNHVDSLISVVVVVHDRPDLLTRCLNSIREQQSPVFECIVVVDGDDASDLVQAVNMVAREDKRFSVVTLGQKRERNYARNVGISLATGKWIVMVDGDDELPASSLLARARAARGSTSNIVFGNLTVLSETADPESIEFANEYRFEDTRLGWPHHCTLLLPAQCAKAQGYPAARSDITSAASEIAGEDVAFMMSLFQGGNISKFVNIGTPVYSYRRYRSSSYTYRDISIHKVISVLIEYHGMPVGADTAYRQSVMDRALMAFYWNALRILSKEGARSERLPKDDLLITLALPANHDDIERTFPAFSRDAEKVMALPPGLLDQVKSVVASQVMTTTSRLAASTQFSSGLDSSQKLPRFSRLLRWKNRHGSEECVLMCNGPSLNEVDFSRIQRSRFTFIGLNKIYLGMSKFQIAPKYIVAVNRNVLDQAAEAYSMLPITKFVSDRVSPDFIREDPFTFFMKTAVLPTNHQRFSRDIVEYVHEGWTVTHAALQIIHYMGFKRVFIIGMDHNFKQHVPGLENKSATIEGDDVDHFHPGYFGHGQTWDHPDLKRSEESYKAAREAYEQDGRDIVDCTINGKCSVFEKADVSVIYDD